MVIVGGLRIGRGIVRDQVLRPSFGDRRVGVAGRCCTALSPGDDNRGSHVL